jgi:hypothetical protein
VLAVTFVVLLLVTLFPSCVKADIQLTSEFMEPVKNWSFEDIDLSVCEAQSWASNNGGWRALRSDVNEDGIVSGGDRILIGNALFSEPGDPNYNPNADLNGDRYINGADMIICGNDFWKEMGVDAFCLNDNHSWYTSGGGDYIMWQKLDPNITQTIAGQKVLFSFYFYPESVASDGSQNNARAEIYYEYSGGSHTENGTWIAPTELNWWNAYVTASLPSTTTTVKVIIHGIPDFKAYIDSASLSIYDYGTKEEPGKGKLALGVNIYEWHIIGGAPQPNGKVFLLPTLYAESSSEDYKIRWIELKVELLPNDGSSTTQNGFIDVRYCAQENNEGHDIEPANPEEAQARMLEAAGVLITFGTAIAIGIGVGIATGGAGLATIPLWLEVVWTTSVETTVGGAIIYTLQQFASEPVDEHAQMGTDYFVREKWVYPTSYKEYQPEPFVESVSGQYTLDWTFNTASASLFQIKATATVSWGKVVFHRSPQTFDWWSLDPAGSTSISRTTTIQL